MRFMRNALVLALAALLAALAVGAGAVSANASGGEVFVNCQTFESGGFHYYASVRPSTCVFQGLPSVGVNEWKLSNLRWSGWGTSIAVATGLYHYRHGEYRDGKLVYRVVPTRIALFRVRVGCHGRRYYTSASEGEETNRLSASCTAG